MHPIFQSKKSSMALIAALLAALGVHFGWSTEQIAVVLAPLVAYGPQEMLVDRMRSSRAAPAPVAEGKP